ncbi:MAG TPA: proton-translocating transhydrogenase family protein, partial [Bacteroidia bacterium]|nr:proton-translocating transhydrogenase family protein [Bacteroidia bacterium]
MHEIQEIGKQIIGFISENKEMLYFVILSVFVGIEVIGGVPTVLHTPLMSGANAIHGVVIVGAIHVMVHMENPSTLA